MENMILAILQARYSSSRLPQKVLMPILGKPMLIHQIERINLSKHISKLVVATSVDESDNIIEKVCLDNNIEVFRGDLDNVLDRFYKCAKNLNPDYIVRLTGDCPLIDWQLIDRTIEYCLNGNYDYVETSEKFPDGLDVEIMNMSSLTYSWKKSRLPSEIEHVTQYIIKNHTIFKNGVLDSNDDLSFLRWTVDEFEDYSMVKKIYEELYPKNPFFLTDEILILLKQRPELTEINKKFSRNEGLAKSIRKDMEFL